MGVSLVDCSIEVPVGALSANLHYHRDTKQLVVLLRVRLVAVVDLPLTEGGERERGEKDRGKKRDYELVCSAVHVL